jgi:DNA-binding response OmpR family regulator
METKQLVIVVIDDPFGCLWMKIVLGRQGHHVHDFLDPIAAVYALRMNDIPLPDLLFVEMHLPRLDGIQVIRAVRNHPAEKHLPIIVISECMEGVKERLFVRLAGATTYLVKPCTTQAVVALIKHYEQLKH